MLSKRQTEFIDVLKNSLGVTSLAMQQTGVTHEEFTDWKQNVFFRQELQVVEDVSIDYVENQLYKQIREGNTQAITFYLKTKGKKRGY